MELTNWRVLTAGLVGETSIATVHRVERPLLDGRRLPDRTALISRIDPGHLDPKPRPALGEIIDLHVHPRVDRFALVSSRHSGRAP